MSKNGEYALGLHTTSPELGLGLTNFKGESRYQAWALGRDLSTYLHCYLAQFILPQTWSDLLFIAVAKGPGSVTGSRIGIVTARTLAQQLDIPLFAISTLAAIAWSQVSEVAPVSRDITIAVEMPARRGEVSAAIYQITSSPSGLTPVLPDTALPVQAWQQTLEAEPSHPLVIRADESRPNVANSCRALLELAYQQWQLGDRPHWSEALPFYSQASPAQSMPLPKP